MTASSAPDDPSTISDAHGARQGSRRAKARREAYVPTALPAKSRHWQRRCPRKEGRLGFFWRALFSRLRSTQNGTLRLDPVYPPMPSRLSPLVKATRSRFRVRRVDRGPRPPAAAAVTKGATSTSRTAGASVSSVLTQHCQHANLSPGLGGETSLQAEAHETSVRFKSPMRTVGARS